MACSDCAATSGFSAISAGMQQAQARFSEAAEAVASGDLEALPAASIAMSAAKFAIEAQIHLMKMMDDSLQSTLDVLA